MTHRRDVLRAGVAAPLGLLALVGREAEAAAQGTPPPYTISINIEIMFRARQPAAVAGRPHSRDRRERIQGVQLLELHADERKAMIQAQKETGLNCVSLVGTGTAGGTTGFTKPGAQDALLAEIKERVEIAKEFGTHRTSSASSATSSTTCRGKCSARGSSRG